jgi:hypothetical protein
MSDSLEEASGNLEGSRRNVPPHRHCAPCALTAHSASGILHCMLLLMGGGNRLTASAWLAATDHGSFESSIGQCHCTEAAGSSVYEVG